MRSPVLFLPNRRALGRSLSHQVAQESDTWELQSTVPREGVQTACERGKERTGSQGRTPRLRDKFRRNRKEAPEDFYQRDFPLSEEMLSR